MAKKEDKTVVEDDELEASEEETEVVADTEEEGDVDVSDEEPSRREIWGDYIDANVTGDEEAAKAAFSKVSTQVVKSILNPEPEAVEDETESEAEVSEPEGTEEDKDD